MADMIWRIRCAFHACRLLRCSPLFAWDLSGSILVNERDMHGDDPDPLRHPREAVLEELSYWGD